MGDDLGSHKSHQYIDAVELVNRTLGEHGWPIGKHMEKTVLENLELAAKGEKNMAALHLSEIPALLADAYDEGLRDALREGLREERGGVIRFEEDTPEGNITQAALDVAGAIGNAVGAMGAGVVLKNDRTLGRAVTPENAPL